MIHRRHILLLAAAGALGAGRVFAGPFGDDASGIAGNAPQIKGWATACLEYVQPDAASGGYAHDNDSENCDPAAAVTGSPSTFVGAQTRHVLSLGNGGSVTLSFDHPIENRGGADFAVFENGFTALTDWTGTSRAGSMDTYTFAELAFVEVATVTSAWARFPATCLNTSVLYAFDDLENDRFASQDVTLLDGLAGKHTIEYGTPFDLSVLTNHPAVLGGDVDLRNILYVRVVDAIGDGSTTDAEGRAVYDPFYHHQEGYPEPAPLSATDGFDLRGVAVLHFADVSIVPAPPGVEIRWYAATGFTYQAESCISPSGSWSPIGSAIAGDNAEHGVLDQPGTGCRSYRVTRTANAGGEP